MLFTAAEEKTDSFWADKELCLWNYFSIVAKVKVDVNIL